MSNVPHLGRVQFLPVRGVWDNEATSFTPWLLENEDILGELLGIELTLSQNEHKVGDFSLDLFGRNLTADTPLIVENQLAKTDHSHLGQLLTYAGGLQPGTVVWVATEFRDEHRAALDWLNEVTDENTHFFGVVVKAIRIGQSAPAPWLELVVKPNTWSELTRRATHSVTNSETMHRYFQFWESFLNAQGHKHPVFEGKKPPSRHYITLKTGIGGVWVGLNVQRKQIYADLYFYESAERNLERFEYLLAHKEEVERTFGDSLSWQELEDSKATRIGYYGEGSLLDEENWAVYQEWLADAALRFLRVTELPSFQELRSVG